MRYNMNITPSNFNPAPAYVIGTDNGWSGVYTGGPFADKGLLYQWSAAMNNSTTERSRGICPSGWHIPSDCEWMYLENTLGMSTAQQISTGARTNGTVGSDLSSLTSSGNNNSGVTALLSGSRNPANGLFINNDGGGVFWTSTAVSGTTARYRQILSTSTGVERGTATKPDSFSVRCVAD